MAEVTRFYHRSTQDPDTGLWQGSVRPGYARVSKGGEDTEARGPRESFTLPKYADPDDARAAAIRLGRCLWGTAVRCVNDNGDPRSDSAKDRARGR